jgi:hypothetical protein
MKKSSRLATPPPEDSDHLTTNAVDVAFKLDNVLETIGRLQKLVVSVKSEQEAKDEVINNLVTHNKKLQRQTRLLSAQKGELEDKLAAIQNGTMCPACLDTRLYSKDKKFEGGNQIFGHIRGMQDRTHCHYRQGPKNATCSKNDVADSD